MATLARKKARRNGLRKYLGEVTEQLKVSLEDTEITQANLLAVKGTLTKVSQQLSGSDEEYLNFRFDIRCSLVRLKKHLVQFLYPAHPVADSLNLS